MGKSALRRLMENSLDGRLFTRSSVDGFACPRQVVTHLGVDIEVGVTSGFRQWTSFFFGM